MPGILQVRPPLVAAGVVVVVVVAVVAVLALSREAPAPSSAYGRLSDALCSVKAQADAGEVAAARRTFFDSAHEPLHALASEAALRDRRAAARLLEAKEAVERGFAGPPPALAGHLDGLVGASRSAIVATGAVAPGPCRP